MAGQLAPTGGTVDEEGHVGEEADPGPIIAGPSVGVAPDPTARVPGAGLGRLRKRTNPGPNRTASRDLGLGLR